MNYFMIAFIYIVSSLDKLGRIFILGVFSVLAYFTYMEAGPLAAAPVFAFGCLLWFGSRQ